MPKKGAIKIDSAGETTENPMKKYEELQQKIIENLVELQRVHTNLAEKFDNLTTQISSLLQLFEMAAKSFAAGPAAQVSEKDKDFLEKIDKLLDQNKLIAKGLTLIEEKVRERMYGFQMNQPAPDLKKEEETLQPSAINKPLPRF
jgi:hypothetical protein